MSIYKSSLVQKIVVSAGNLVLLCIMGPLQCYLKQPYQLWDL